MGRTEQPSRERLSRAAPWVVLIMLVVASLGAFGVTRRLVGNQEQRLLRERTREVGALLSSSFESIESSLRVLGPLGASSHPAASRMFADSAAPLVEGETVGVGVATQRNSDFVVVNRVGDGPIAGEPLSGDQTALARRALVEDQLVSALFSDAQGTRLLLALPVPSVDAVIYQEAVLDPSTPVPSTPDSPFRELRVALYGSAREDPSALIVTTDEAMPLSGRVEHHPFPVGADRWLLVVGANEQLASGFSHAVPWILLGGGLTTAVLASAITWALMRRRSYALELVRERTGELEAALDERHRAQGFLDQVLRALPVLVTRISVDDQRITYVSPNVDRLLGLEDADLLSPDLLAERIHPDDRHEVFDGFDRVAAGATQETLEYRFRHGDGTYRWLSMVAVPEVDDAGRVTGIFACALDDDDRHRAEEARRDAQETAEAANRSKSQFLSRMSHELRTPLNAILGFGQLLELDPLSADQRDSVRQILKAGRHLLDLINEVLDVSRIEAGELALSAEPVLTCDVIQDAVDLIRPLADRRDIALVTERSALDDGYVFADRQRAKQVLLNLLSNAVKYNRPGGSVRVSCERVEDRVRIHISDTGHGLTPEQLGRLFTPFERLGAEATDVEGTGIGLALSQRLTEAMGGTVSATSALGEGSTFSVELAHAEGPVEGCQGSAKGVEWSSAASHDRRHRVLYVEDNLVNLRLVERILAQRAGVELVGAGTGRLGLELAREEPSLILLDLHLPDIGGEEVLQRLRDDPVTASIPVVIVSADATAGQVGRLLDAGANGYLTKPIDVTELLEIVDDTLSKAGHHVATTRT